METVKQKDEYKISRLLYIIEAALEYFVSIAVGTVYLARLTAYIGISDSITGILSAFVSLGCGFQILAIFLANKRPVKRWVTAGHIFSQTLFALLYFIPLLSLSREVKTIIFICSLLIAHIIHNIINSPKINWYMSLVEDKKRGRFTANKEIVSLLGGMVFSYGLGFIMDHFESNGAIRTAFIVCGIGLFALMLFHSATLIFAQEKQEIVEKTSVKKTLSSLFQNKALFKILVIPILWNVANYAVISFSGTYQTKELAFSTTFASIVIIVGSLCRAAFSRPLGAFADKHSFTKMLYICFGLEALAFALNIFTIPNNGKVFYMIFYILYCVGFAGINSATINLIYDYVTPELRTSALALSQTFAGFAGFFTTLLLSPLVECIQEAGNKFLGVPMYAQQLLSGVGLFVVVLIVIYMFLVVNKIKKEN